MISKSDYDITEAIRFFNKFSVEASYLVPTYIGLEKSIMDATAPFRTYLKLKGIHNYEGQIQGPEGKVKVDAFIVTESTLIPTSASLYRPVAKGKSGDPRVWFSKLNSYANPDNLIAIVASESKLFVVNMSRPEIVKSASISGSPLNKLLTSVGTSSSDIAEELLEKLRDIAKLGWIQTVTSGDTGVGATLEHCLGIKINSSKNPDYKGIELKTRRVSKFKAENRSTLFAKVPDWSLSHLKKSSEILDAYGYMRGSVKKLYCTVKAGTPNPQGLFFQIDGSNDQLHEVAMVSQVVQPVAIWEFDVLRNQLLTKHNETFWIAASAEKKFSSEFFKYEKVKHTRLPFATNFDTLCDQGIITMDHAIKRQKNAEGNDVVTEKGPLFKINPSDLGLLFPPPLEYELT